MAHGAELASNNPFRSLMDAKRGPDTYTKPVRGPSPARKSTNPFIEESATVLPSEDPDPFRSPPRPGKSTTANRAQENVRDNTLIDLGPQRPVSLDSARPSRYRAGSSPQRGSGSDPWRMARRHETEEERAERHRQRRLHETPEERAERHRQRRLHETEEERAERHRQRRLHETEEERAERHRRRRERYERERESKKSSGTAEKHKARARRESQLDKIDRLDVTGLYGNGFHHDGPFDACNPARNKHEKRAPVLAFPENSESNSMRLGVPVPQYDRARLFGEEPEAYEDFANARTSSSAPKVLPTLMNVSSSFDPKMNPVVHGHESAGLGTTTFLEGTPAVASRPMVRAHSDSRTPSATTSTAYGATLAPSAAGAQGLGRKVSIAKRLGMGRKNSASSVGSTPQISVSPDTTGKASPGGHGSSASSPEEASLRFDDSARLGARKEQNGDGLGGNSSGLLKRVRSLRVSGRRANS